MLDVAHELGVLIWTFKEDKKLAIVLDSVLKDDDECYYDDNEEEEYEDDDE